MQTNNKLREALESVAKQLIDATEDENFGEDVMYLVGCMRTMSRKCRAALAEPVKNCEVGTPSEQADRMRHFCLYDQGGCGACSRRKDMTFRECIIDWGQMPYEANEKGEVDDTNGRTVQQQGEV